MKAFMPDVRTLLLSLCLLPGAVPAQDIPGQLSPRPLPGLGEAAGTDENYVTTVKPTWREPGYRVVVTQDTEDKNTMSASWGPQTFVAPAESCETTLLTGFINDLEALERRMLLEESTGYARYIGAQELDAYQVTGVPVDGYDYLYTKGLSRRDTFQTTRYELRFNVLHAANPHARARFAELDKRFSRLRSTALVLTLPEQCALRVQVSHIDFNAAEDPQSVAGDHLYVVSVVTDKVQPLHDTPAWQRYQGEHQLALVLQRMINP